MTVGDVATVEDSVKEPRSLSRWDNKNAVSLVVRKQSGENTIGVVDRVKERYQEIKGTLPPGVEVIFTRDASTFIREAVRTVQEHLVLGGICAAFSADLRSTPTYMVNGAMVDPGVDGKALETYVSGLIKK